jgi:hypothetical protein
VVWVRERTKRPSLVSEVSANLVPRGLRDILYGRIFGFLERSRYFFFQVAPQLYQRGWEDPVADDYFSENAVALRIEPGPLSVAGNSDQ